MWLCQKRLRNTFPNVHKGRKGTSLKYFRGSFLCAISRLVQRSEDFVRSWSNFGLTSFVLIPCKKVFVREVETQMHSLLTKEQRASYLREVFYSSYSDRRYSTVTRNSPAKNSGKLLKTLHFMIEAGKGLSAEAENTLKELIEIRKRGRPSFYEAKLLSDYKKFLFLRGRREHQKAKAQEQTCFHCIENDFKNLPVLMEDDWYWGTRQQLRCGEIISDTLGAMDGIFGVLLYPAGGKTEHANPKRPFRFTTKEEQEIEALLYHTAVHDACGYLREYHGLGPGYNYLGTNMTVFPTCFPQSGRLAALSFWKKLITEPEIPDVY